MFIDTRNTGPDRGFRRAVEVPQLTAARQQLAGQVARQGFATAEDPQVLLAGPATVDQHLPGGWSGLHRGDPLLIEQALQLQGIHGRLARGQDHAGAVDQGQVQFKRGDVEGDRGDRQQAILRRKPRFTAHAVEEVAQGPMADLHALRQPGGTGGVDDIGQVFRVQSSNSTGTLPVGRNDCKACWVRIATGALLSSMYVKRSRGKYGSSGT